MKREPYEAAYTPQPTYTTLTTSYSPAAADPRHTDRRVPSIGEAAGAEAEAMGDVLKTTYGTWDADSGRLLPPLGVVRCLSAAAGPIPVTPRNGLPPPPPPPRAPASAAWSC